MRSITQFFAPPDRIRGDRLALPPEEARHALKVLRASAGDEIVVVDGVGGWYRVVLDQVAGDTAAGHIVERRHDIGEAPYELTLGFGLIKQRARMEILLEKAVELGVSCAVPLITERTEKDSVRERRLEKVLIAAMKQCGRSRQMFLGDVEPLDVFLTRESFDLALCCHEALQGDARLIDALKKDLPRRVGVEEAPSRPSIVALIGPEGGFSPQEIERAAAAGYRLVSLGDRRLRAETAAITVAAAISLVYDHSR